MTKILITSTSYKNTTEAVALLESRGYDIAWNPHGRPLTAAELITLLDGCEGVIAGLDDFSATVFEQVRGLRVVARYGVGVDRVDLEAARHANVVVTNTPSANSDAVADLTIGLMLAVARHLVMAHEEASRGKWTKVYGVALHQKTVGLVGLGRIGERVAKRVQGFDCPVLVYDPYLNSADAQMVGCRKVATLEELLKASDFISLHAPVTPDNTKMINAETLAMMKPKAILINTAQGELIDDDALKACLLSKSIGGAGLDSYTLEPLPAGHYDGIANIVITPHIGAYTAEALYQMACDSTSELIAVLEGDPPQYRLV